MARSTLIKELRKYFLSLRLTVMNCKVWKKYEKEKVSLERWLKS